MTQNKSKSFGKKMLLSVDNLRLWTENPRFDPELDLSTDKQFAYAISRTDSERKSFIELVKSIASKGFMNIDPIIVFKHKTRYYVAEGNRRVLALKLLRNPELAPKSIKSQVARLSKDFDADFHNKIQVTVVPTLDDAQWYIGQRNNISSLRETWSRIQQGRWIGSLLNICKNDFENLKDIVQMPESTIILLLRNEEYINLINVEQVRSKLTEKEYKKATNYYFSITILERFFGFARVQEKWGISFDKTQIIIKNPHDFFNAYAELIKKIVNNNEEDTKINTRIKKENIDDILSDLPVVNLDEEGVTPLHINVLDKNISYEDSPKDEEEAEAGQVHNTDNAEQTDQEAPQSKFKNLLNDKTRRYLVPDNIKLETFNPRIRDLFKELKKCPVNSYPNIIAGSIRILLELVILEWFEGDGLVTEIQKKYGEDISLIGLKKRILFVKEKKNSDKDKTVSSICDHLLNNSNEYSLNTLNGYIHCKHTYNITKERMNGFFDFLFPFLQEFLDLTVLRD